MAVWALLSLAVVFLVKTTVIATADSTIAGDTLQLSELMGAVSANATEIELANAQNTSQYILLSKGGAYAWQFYSVRYGANRSQRLLVVFSTLFNKTVIWMANRDHPVSPNATLVILRQRSPRIALRDGDGSIVWSPSVTNISAIVMNSTGNLYMLDETSTKLQWQSFDDLSDTVIPGQRLSINHSIAASLSWDDWRSGYYTLKAEPGGLVFYASFDSQQSMVPYEIRNYVNNNDSITESLHSDCNHTYILYNDDGSGFTLEQQGEISPQCLKELNYRPSTRGFSFPSIHSGDGFRFARLVPRGDINSFFLSNSTGLLLDSELLRSFYGTYCKLPSYCGVNALCSATDTCSCPQLFQAIDPTDDTQGCSLETPLNCSAFMEHQFLQVPGSDYYANSYLAPHSIVRNYEDCTKLCLQNCSCTAAFHNNKTGECHIYDQVRTIRYLSNPNVNAFLRVSSLPAAPGNGGDGYMSRWVIIGISLGSSVAAVLLVSVLAWRWSKRKAKSPYDEPVTEEEMFLDRTKPINAHHNLVRVAVKKLNTSALSYRNASNRQFRAEVATLGNVNHINLIQLKGFCAEGVHRILIYEFAENGSLDKWIFPAHNMSSPPVEAQVLPSKTRYRIAVDTAKGLAFLHEECRDKVVHFDVKPQNILLDADFRAKLADFGLSKLEATQSGNIEQSVMAMRGTPGYMAPEWFHNLPVTEKSDVFSYGMVLLELVGGRRNLNTAAATRVDWYLPAWAVRQAEEGRILDVIDKRLMDQLSGQSHEDRDAALASMERLINVAFWCIQGDASTRPSMMTVVLMLEEHLEVPDPPLATAYVPFSCSSMSSTDANALHRNRGSGAAAEGLIALASSSATSSSTVETGSYAVEMNSVVSAR
ncbi:hypothetical protein KP509_24G036300 [Ceratopteris richardii]|uniref:Receptor-like serine/threonine-protein kinase n=1 Tax=Ceratopteris richardii TaxID=49495 RepID=A0A8T2RVM1_CERRI|nr:hypothetical protein KP509_24G036300 [Ceratopteris richardii]